MGLRVPRCGRTKGRTGRSLGAMDRHLSGMVGRKGIMIPLLFHFSFEMLVIYSCQNRRVIIEDTAVAGVMLEGKHRPLRTVPYNIEFWLIPV